MKAERNQTMFTIALLAIGVVLFFASTCIQALKIMKYKEEISGLQSKIVAQKKHAYDIEGRLHFLRGGEFAIGDPDYIWGFRNEAERAKNNEWEKRVRRAVEMYEQIPSIRSDLDKAISRIAAGRPGKKKEREE